MGSGLYFVVAAREAAFFAVEAAGRISLSCNATRDSVEHSFESCAASGNPCR
jgi:hypothetical protein